ncbi:43401_t:CDS:2, partial [Gigaspora margarita]
AVSDISQHILRQLLQGEFKNQLFLDKDLANIIQHFRKSNTTDPEKDPKNDASNFLKVLRIFKEEDPTWAEYRDYLKNLFYNIGTLASSWVFSKLIEYLKSVLKDEIFQIQKAPINVCFEYNTQPIPFEQVSLYDNADAIDNTACIEDHLDKRQIALKSLIKHVDVGNIIELWKVQYMNINTILTNCKIFYNFNKESMAQKR